MQSTSAALAFVYAALSIVITTAGSQQQEIKVFKTIRTKFGLDATVFAAEGTSGKFFFYSPLAILNRDSVKRDFDQVKQKHEVTFEIEMWSEEYHADIVRQVRA
jgi:hypothetical protein